MQVDKKCSRGILFDAQSQNACSCKQSYLYLRGMPDDSYRVTLGNYFTMDVRGLKSDD